MGTYKEIYYSRRVEMQTAEPIVPEPSALEVEKTVAKLKKTLIAKN
jgi:hypothetical protein